MEIYLFVFLNNRHIFKMLLTVKADGLELICIINIISVIVNFHKAFIIAAMRAAEPAGIEETVIIGVKPVYNSVPVVEQPVALGLLTRS